MKLSQVMGISLDGDYYQYGDKLIKLYHDAVTRNRIEEIFLKHQIITQGLNKAARVLAIKAIDGQWGIVFKAIAGQSMLSKMEDQPNDLLDFAEKFAEIHKSIHRIDLKGIPSQMTYFSDQLALATIDNAIKLELLDFLKGEQHYQKLCHGMFQPDKIICDGEDYTIIDFDRAYRGNPFSDVAMTHIILESPRLPKEASDFLQEQIHYSRQVFQKVYTTEYDMDFDHYDQYRKLAAIVRLNDQIDEEKAWLMSIINGS